jgi:RNase H-fold protein (predicted Holliday junction resolvase)
MRQKQIRQRSLCRALVHHVDVTVQYYDEEKSTVAKTRILRERVSPPFSWECALSCVYVNKVTG